jgi:hypothetical protein
VTFAKEVRRSTEQSMEEQTRGEQSREEKGRVD